LFPLLAHLLVASKVAAVKTFKTKSSPVLNPVTSTSNVETGIITASKELLHRTEFMVPATCSIP
jgi:hypothetical protein